MTEERSRDAAHAEYEARKAELKEAIRHATAWSREVEALQKIVTGYEDYFAARPTDRGGQVLFEEVREIEKPTAGHPAAEQADDGNFRTAVLEIIAEQKRGVRFPKIKAEAEKRKLTTRSATLDAAIRYAINGLKGQGKIRTPRRGVYKAVIPKPPPAEANGSIRMELVKVSG
jgi:hypothetical protein